MAKTRLDLQQYLVTLTSNVYFQPPENVKLKYPCIVYSRTRIDGTFANNDVYKLDHGYRLIYITRDPDDPLIDVLAKLQTCRFQREFVSDSLYHDEYIIYWN
jgi:hypothetical protein